ncbi:ABC transporter ATP-binding protein [Anaerolineales bacterium HSG24]|nr:ABC transporter ATP-binding protein [Anaerolineales bacterium HSG24]
MSIIQIKNLSKNFGRRTAVNDISFDIEAGSLFGFIGPNGAGKTTTIRVLTTLLKPSAGQVLVDGHSVVKQPREVRKVMGYMPDFFGVYNDMTVWEYLDFFCGCYEIEFNQRKSLISDLLELVDLSKRHDDYVDSLSRGMKQRLSLARSLVHDPKVLVLDEPASGLDPRARVEFRELLVELRRLNKTIFFSSHILSDIAEICNQVGIVEQGNLISVGHIDTLKRQLRETHHIRLRVMGDTVERAKSILATSQGVGEVEADPASDGDWDIIAEFSGDKPAVTTLLKQLVLADVPILSFAAETDSLEDVFMKLTEGGIL